MPKATWGSGGEALTAADIDGAEQREGFAPYSGPIPPAGLYRFVLKFAKKGQSSTGNPKLQMLWELDGDWKPEHAKFEGAPLWDNMPVMKSTAWRVAAFCEAVGITSAEFLNKMVVDEDGKVTKLGSLGDPAGIMAYINVSKRPANAQYAEQLQLNGAGYLPAQDGEEAQEPGDVDKGDDEDGDEPPF
jgi:hypothetical protein